MNKRKLFIRRVRKRLGELPPRGPRGSDENYERIRQTVMIEKEEAAKMRDEKRKKGLEIK